MLHADQNEIAWNGRELSVTVQTDTGSVRCILPRRVINGISIYNDALGWEIERHKLDIFDRLKHALLIKLNGLGKGVTGPVSLTLADIIAK